MGEKIEERVIEASAPGKVILFGEHAVVYGMSAVAVAISQRSYCTIRTNKTDHFTISLENYGLLKNFDDLHEMVKKKKKKFQFIPSAISFFKSNFNLPHRYLFIKLSTSLWPMAGLGSSASIGVALAGALSKYYDLKLSSSVIVDIAYELEKFAHGTPSGVDNSICTYGAGILFQKNRIQKFDCPEKFKILIIYSNEIRKTKTTVGKVRKLLEKSPRKIKELFDQIGMISNEGIKAVTNGDLRSVGRLMNQNQLLLSKLGISTPVIDEIIEFCLSSGAYGSKLTGAGGGGSIITIGSIEILTDIKNNLKLRGYDSIISEIDPEGLKINEFNQNAETKNK